MKNFTFLISLFFLSLGYAQPNQSFGTVSSTIASPPPFAPEEIFRFRRGLVTQLDQGNFNFGLNDRWFSSGRLTTGSQTVYGLRYQVNGKSLILGYNNIDNINPRIQWIGLPGETLGDLEFRYARDFMSTDSFLSAAMRRDGSTVFSRDKNFSVFDESKVGILASGQRREGIQVWHENSDFDFSAAGSFYAIAHQGQGIGVFGQSRETNGQGYGVYVGSFGASQINFGVYGEVGNADQSYAIYGRASSTGTGQFAGFFDGNVEVTGSFLVSSDKKLKENIKEEEGVLEKLANLNPVEYNFKTKEGFNLPIGKQHGFIAQELEEVYPELVQDVIKPLYDKEGRPSGGEEFKSVNYIGLIGVLTKSIQELNAKVESLEEKLKNNSETYVVKDVQLSKELESSAYSLEQNYPNPFDGQSVIAYKLPETEENASIMVFDMTGNLKKEYRLTEKEGKIIINASDFKNGIYLYSLISSNKEIITKRMIIK